MSKVIRCDNYDREMYSELLVAENLSEVEAQKIADAMNDDPNRADAHFYKVRDDSYKLFEFEP